MAYLEITGLPIRGTDEEFGATVSIECERERGMTVVSDNGRLPGMLADAVLGRIEFAGEIFLNNMRIDPMPPKARKIGVLGETPGIVPGKTVRENLELALGHRADPSTGDLVYLIDEELTEGPLAGLDDTRADSLGEIDRTLLAATRLVMTGHDLIIVTALPVPDAYQRSDTRVWRPGIYIDGLLELKNLFRRFRATWLSLLTDTTAVQILSDRIVVFAQDTLVQDGSLRECINAPAAQLVADFLTFPRMNYKKTTVERDGPFVMLRTGRYGFRVSEYAKRHLTAREGAEIIFGIKPEDLGIRPYVTGDPTVMNLAKIIRVDNIPGAQVVRLDTEGSEWISLVEPGRAVLTGQLVELRHDPDKVHLFHPVNGLSLLD